MNREAMFVAVYLTRLLRIIMLNFNGQVHNHSFHPTKYTATRMSQLSL